ncbi:MAG: hypothetical protein LBB82_09720, partial [Treponema sp.]|nr:hypothetical protein [Treponema sp.]
PLASEFLSLKSLCNKDLRLTKHPTFKEAVPKTEVLEQPHFKNIACIPEYAAQALYKKKLLR